MSSILTVPAPIRSLFAYFPLHTWPTISPPSTQPSSPTLWIHPPRRRESDWLSGDLECLKWQAYLALRGVIDVAVRWDISPDGAMDSRLPNLHVPGNGGEQLLTSRDIPSWVDSQVGKQDPFDGYKDQLAKDESQAWTTILEKNVHAALVAHQSRSTPLPFLLSTGFPPVNTKPVEALIMPPPAPLSGFSSLLPPYGAHFSLSHIEIQYRDAISALSERLGTDKWFLGSEGPTKLDALAFAYLHVCLDAQDSIRVEVNKRVNLVAWEWRLRGQVQAAFRQVVDEAANSKTEPTGSPRNSDT